jgi:hypothetical protein
MELAWTYREVFGSVQPGSITSQEHRSVIPEDKEARANMYPVKPDAEPEAEKQIKGLLAKGIIEEVDATPHLAPVVMISRKKDGKTKWRMCIDYRTLNKLTERDAYQMPIMTDQLNVRKAGFFTKLDLASAFWKVPIRKRDRVKTSFSFQGRTYQWRVMPFGLRNAPATFQRLVDKVFKGMVGINLYV